MTVAAVATSPRPHVAIVGAGPKGLHALERLIAHLPSGEGPQISVFEPATPGAGPAYDPRLDAALLMNLRADLIDAWPRDGERPIARDAAHPDFTAWSSAQGLAPAGGYAPRREVGAYLAAALAQVQRDAARCADVELRREQVHGLEPTGDGRWTLLAADGDAPLAVADQVLLATGHGAPSDGFDARLLDPALAQLGGPIVTRGFGLTTLDLVRLLDHHGAFSRGMRLHAVSRSGRPPLAKPAPAVDDVLRPACGDPSALPWPDHGRLTLAWLRAATLQLASSLLDALNPAATRSVETTLAELEARPVLLPAEATDRLRRSIDVATAAAPPDAAAALGIAWRVLQDGLARHGSFGGLAWAELPALRQYAAALELVAFGPPVASARTLLAALDAGHVQLHASPRGLLPPELIAPPAVVIDTVLPAPGVVPGSLVGALVARGEVQRVPQGRGVLIDASGAALDADGEPVPGLSLIGRPTEDAVLANDTLSRTMHGVAERWGARVAAAVAAAPTLVGSGTRA